MRSSAVREAPVAVRILVGAVLAAAVGQVLQQFRVAPDPGASVANELRAVSAYLGESAAPFLLVPFAVGRTARTRAGAACGGVASCWIVVAGYYGWFVPGSPALLRGGGGGEPVVWLAAALPAGAVCGLLGAAAVRGSRWRLLMPAALVLEPLGWLVLLRLRVAPVLAQPQDVVGAVVEAVVGVVWLVLAVRRSTAHRSVAVPLRGS